ncbi:AfsR/SARP family transcriptional regulator [Streptomyces radicis]|uniref:AfsR/SARP family transcriptional regulator n=1 Tax=Streptomyces radicis TaxID=1750517 RepID=A0A3A9WDZ0_9ACTN|nr:AfsR/SARP family transcriptional regulator [Streptomyces radicis]RKN10980.1 AfsR/SARP family transcriptional regulator [Streptomyces radicis]RKN25243.1 AfsR/SARP family transcriptional regulator [Streptomyces radicis]
MDIRLLGPFEVVADDGSALPVSAPMLRTALAALALREGRVMPTGELAEALWGPEPPPTFRTTLRNYVMRLRKVIPGERILTHPGGYQLRAARDETDIGRFREALARARACAGSAPGEAAELLDGAVALWRGTPLGDLVDSPLRTAEQPRIEELYLTAVEERFELKLALGQHAAITEELAAAARAHRLRERLTGQLMLALYRSGRTAEALAVYREARALLVDELGIEPGAGLRSIEAAILRDDAGLVAPEPAPERAPGARPGAGTGAVVGAAFPPGIATFVARGLELARLRGWLGDTTAAPAVCLIDGPGGVGKSTLAVRAAREVGDRFPDGLLHVDLRGSDPHHPPLETAEARRLLLASLGVPGKAVPPPALVDGVMKDDAADAFYRECLGSRRVLVLLDNALDAAQAAPLLPVEAGQAALITSRAAFTGLRGGHHLHLPALATADAVTLVQTVSGSSPDRGTPDEWELLATLCGRLPLALGIVATRMAARPRWRVADFTAVLADERGRMDELAVDDLDVRASLMVSIDQLAASDDAADRLAADVFPLLGTAATLSYGAESAAALTGRRAREARDALERLVDAQIATSPRPGAYALHDLVRSAAAWQAARLPQAEARARVAGLARWYLGSLHRVNAPLSLSSNRQERYGAGARRFPEGRSFASAAESLPWADAALDDVVVLARQLAAPEYDEGDDLGGRPLSRFAAESVWALDSYFGARLRLGAQRALCELSLSVGERCGDLFAQAVAYGQLGKAAIQGGEGLRGVELIERSIAMYQSVGEVEEALGCMNNLVPGYGSAGRLAEALLAAERAVAEAERVGFDELLVVARNNMARCHLYLGNREVAHDIFATNYRTATRPYDLTLSAGLLAEYHLETDEFEEAAFWADRAVRHAEEHPFDPFVGAQHHTWLAAALRGLGREEGARAEEARAQAILETLNERENAHLRVRVEEKYSAT